MPKQIMVIGETDRRCQPGKDLQVWILSSTTMRFSRHSLSLWWACSAAAATVSSTCLIRPTASAFVPSSLSRHRFAMFKRKMSSSSTSTSSGRRIALLQFKVTEDKQVNLETAKSYLERAVSMDTQMVVLPEIWNSPYATAAFSDYAEVLPGVGEDDSKDSPSAQLLIDFAKQHNIWIVGGSVPEVVGEKLYNTCLVVSPEGKIVAKHRKVHLFDISVPGGITFRESDTLSAGEGMTCFDSGNNLFGMVGVGICYDIRFPEYALLLNKKYKCNLLIYPGAFNLTTGPAHWELLQRARAVDNQCYVCMASPARSLDSGESKYPHYTAWGHSTVVAPWGDVVATTDEKEDIVVADLDLQKVDEMRTSIPCFQQKRHDLYVLQDPNDE